MEAVKITSDAALTKDISARALELFHIYQQRIYIKTDHIFVVLFILQWIAAFVVAIIVSPRAWEGDYSTIHPHVFIATILGGLLSIYPIYLGIYHSGEKLTRYVIACCQLLWSSIFIHLTGGRIETHFHVFGSLAFIAFYREWKLLILPTLIVAIDHYFRGVYWPQSVFGIMTPDPWRWIEHTAWVLFEDAFLIRLCLDSVVEMKAIAFQTAELEYTNQMVETTVDERTKALRESQFQLEKANKAKDAFLANMSHEIRTPLNGIIGSCSLLKGTSLNEVQQRYIQIITHSGEILLKIIMDILDFSRMNIYKIELKLIDFEIRKLIEETVEIVDYACKQKQLKLSYKISPCIPEVFKGDHIRLKQILVNLLNNAIKFTDRGVITILVEEGQKELREDSTFPLKISVVDTGIGIPEGQLTKIFEPFTQVDNSSTRLYGGIGLGLSIVKRLLDCMGGTISVESVIGLGTKFCFVVSLETIDKSNTDDIKTESVRDEVKLTEKVIAPKVNTRQSISILVAEDNFSNKIIIEEILQNCGFRVKSVSNGQEVLEELEKNQFDLCLMDVQMPVLDGLATTKKIRQSRFKNIPIIALSASVFDADKQKCFDAGMNGFLEKPIRKELLLETIAKWTRQKAKQSV